MPMLLNTQFQNQYKIILDIMKLFMVSPFFFIYILDIVICIKNLMYL